MFFAWKNIVNIVIDDLLCLIDNISCYKKIFLFIEKREKKKKKEKEKNYFLL